MGCYFFLLEACVLQNISYAEPVKSSELTLFSKKIDDAIFTCKKNIKDKKVKPDKTLKKDLGEREASIMQHKALIEKKLDVRNKDPFPDASMINNAVTAYNLKCNSK